MRPTTIAVLARLCRTLHVMYNKRKAEGIWLWKTSCEKGVVYAGRALLKLAMLVHINCSRLYYEAQTDDYNKL